MDWIDSAEAGSFREQEGMLLGVEVRLGEHVLGLGVGLERVTIFLGGGFICLGDC